VPIILRSIANCAVLILLFIILVVVQISAAYSNVGNTHWVNIFFFRQSGNFVSCRYLLSLPSKPFGLPDFRLTFETRFPLCLTFSPIIAHAYHVSSATYHVPRTTYHVPRTTYHVPRTTYHVPRTTYHVPRTTYHVSRATLHYCRGTSPTNACSTCDMSRSPPAWVDTPNSCSIADTCVPAGTVGVICALNL